MARQTKRVGLYWCDKYHANLPTLKPIHKTIIAIIINKAIDVNKRLLKVSFLSKAILRIVVALLIYKKIKFRILYI
jgi:hypothetical protein